VRLEDVQEEYSPDGWYTREYRIEIDAILAKVKAEGLSKYIMYKLKKLAPLDLTRAIDMPANEDLYPAEVLSILSYFNEHKDKVLEDETEQIQQEPQQVSEPTDIKAKEDEIRQRWAQKIILVGMIANTCIEATARLGMELGYHVTLIKDATAAFSHEGMHAAHEVNGPTFAHAILTTNELLGLLPAEQR
jgi:hypothetical protein